MPPAHYDVLIIGAGISLGRELGLHVARGADPGYAILEARDAIGGTWDLFRYPGIRSDSDMQTLGYRFRPWTGEKAIADGPAILEYVRETATEHGVESRIRFNHRVVRAEWSTPEARWSVAAERTDTGERVELSCGFLLSCSGYFDYEEGYTPELAGIERFGGRLIHPQHWPEDLDCSGKRVVVIGSGATAVTLVPALAAEAEHVTMLQRSPSYIVAAPAKDPIANGLRRLLPEHVAYAITRWKNILLTFAVFQISQRRPRLVRALVRKGVQMHLPDDYDVDIHFNPRYDPWDQRMCLVPNADLFRALRQGSAEIATDEIETFTEAGIRLRSGAELEADVVITATGLNLLALGGVQLAVDGREIKVPETIAYKAMMLSGIPNFAFAVGYTNASWTLKVDLTCEYVCRLLRHMDEHGYAQAVPDTTGQGIEAVPLLDFSAGYVQRSVHKFPKQGSRRPWRLRMNYPADVLALRYGSVVDGALRFSPPPPTPAANQAAAALNAG